MRRQWQECVLTTRSVSGDGKVAFNSAVQHKSEHHFCRQDELWKYQLSCNLTLHRSFCKGTCSLLCRRLLHVRQAR